MPKLFQAQPCSKPRSVRSLAFTGTLQGQKRYPSMLPTSTPPTLTSDGGAAAAPGAANGMKSGGAGKGPRVVDTDNVPRPQVMNVISVINVFQCRAWSC